MKRTRASAPIRPFNSRARALGLSLGMALAACKLTAAADTTNATAPAPRTPPPTKLVVPLEWKVEAPAHDYNFDNLPLSEVTLSLQEQTKHQFDVLMPGVIALQAAPPDPGLPVEQIDPGGIAIKLRLKNVSVIEVFQAINMLFEIDHTPVRWELVMNGHRPVAVLQGVLEPKPLPAGPPAGSTAEARPQAVSHCVVYVGNLLGTPDLGRLSSDALCEVVEQTAKETFPASSTLKIQFHRGGELVVLSGTDEELRFMNDVLRALKERVNDRRKGGASGNQEAPAKK